MQASPHRINGISPFQATFPMIGSIMGAGVLNLPTSVEKSGYLLSGPILLTIAAMSAFTLFQLVHCAQKLNKTNPTYFDVCKTAHPLLGYAAEACIGVQGLGCCLVYFLILKSWIAKLLGIEGQLEGSFAMNVAFTVGLMILPMLMAGQKDLKNLSFASVLGTVSVLYLSVVVMGCGALSIIFGEPGTTEASQLIKMNTNPSVVFTAAFEYIFALGCQQNMVRVFSMLEEQTVMNGVKVGVGAVSVATIVFFLVSNGGYIAGGNGQNTSILDILEDKSRPFYGMVAEKFGDKFFYLITLAKVGMIIVLFAGYSLQMHPARDSILTFLRIPFKKQVDRNLRRVEVLTTTAVSVIICLCGIDPVPYKYVMNLIAVTASCYIMYLLPSISYLASTKKTSLFTFISLAILASSLAISGIGLYRILG
ncbi:hypothetical protein NEDG_00302 [Nematocida displodere]|uniref:Amino acid transporter transmembrane domain-containing protein n=1 Tax=Nematocida displodere TaxID=1805483 RepID=A0A177EIR5_9MICR|nr:hypothetical protein NEDG_00302 [Nematocida displodere]